MYSDEEHIIELLLSEGVLDKKKLEQKFSSQLGVIYDLLKQGDLDESAYLECLSANSGLEIQDLEGIVPRFDLLSDKIMSDYQMVPLQEDILMGGVEVVLVDPFNLDAIDSARSASGVEIFAKLGSPLKIVEWLKQDSSVEEGKGSQEKAEEQKKSSPKQSKDVAEEKEELETLDSRSGATRFVGNDDDGAVAELVNKLLMEAIQMEASDIHIEPMETNVQVRYRVDGKLNKVGEYPKALLLSVIARLKIMSGSMSIAEKRLPQDGRIQMEVAGQEIDLRVSSVPSNHGESMVMRILDKSSLLLGLAELGFFL